MTTTFKQLGGLALYGVAYLTAMAIGQVVANTHLILTTLEDLIMELATVTEITDAVITPEYFEVDDTGVDHCYPVQAAVEQATADTADSAPVQATIDYAALSVRQLRPLATSRGIKIRVGDAMLVKSRLVKLLEASDNRQ